MIEAHRQNKRKTGMNEQALGDSNELVHTTDYHTNHAAHVAASSVHMQIYDLEMIHCLSTPDAERKTEQPPLAYSCNLCYQAYHLCCTKMP